MLAHGEFDWVDYIYRHIASGTGLPLTSARHMNCSARVINPGARLGVARRDVTGSTEVRVSDGRRLV
jgi:hypothetical protein